ncbi:histone-arginine methyltransferase METTL23 isoform X2 [Mobula birostris]|uniref:histone-arginine methyltransferase METTL23 isoform X2 n=1 Tax=Mobula birostris TaxID=1983395 RepID=UPI003B28AE55
MSGRGSVSVKQFSFVLGPLVDGPESLEVHIPEVLDPQYGLYIWPCSVVLAQYVWFNKSEVKGKTILEIGAGASLPGIVAAKCGASVILSDCAVFQNCLDNCRRSCQINNLEDVPVIGLTWGQISPDLVQLPQIDIILGSDVFYEPEDFEDILTTVFYLMQKNPKALFWTTYQERSSCYLPLNFRQQGSSQQSFWEQNWTATGLTNPPKAKALLQLLLQKLYRIRKIKG